MVHSDGDIEQDIKGIVATRDAMTEKLELFQARVRGTVGNAKYQVTSVMDRVKGTTNSMKRVVSPSYQIDRHPLTVTSGTIVLGYLLGSYKWTGSKGKTKETTTKSKQG